MRAVSLTPEQSRIKEYAIRHLEAQPASREDTVVFKRCPMCGDDKDWRHRLNVSTGFYWCYRRSCTCRWASLFGLLQSRDANAVMQDVLHGSAVVMGLMSVDHERDTYEIIMDRLHPPAREKDYIPYSEVPAGYAPLTEWSEFTPVDVLEYARYRGVSMNAVECGYVPKEFGHPWASRLIFPVRDIHGRLRGCVGRAVNKYIEPRYYSNVDQDHMVWGLDRVAEGDHIALAEGCLSAIAIPRPAVASLSKQFNPAQAALIAAVKPASVTVMLDADVRAQHLLRVCQLLVDAGVASVYLTLLDDGDPADNREATARALEDAIPFEGTNQLRIIYGHENP